MSDLQWLWCYFNILEDEQEEELKWKSRLDYLGWWINPQLAKSVIEIEKRNENKGNNKSSFGNEPTEDDPSVNSNQITVKGDVVKNDTFEDEFKKALAEAGVEEKFTELPDSQSVGDAFESQEDFITRALANQELIEPIINDNIKSLESTVQELGLDMNDIDFFEFPEE